MGEQVRLVRHPHVGPEPWLDQREPAGRKVPGEAARRRREPVGTTDEADRAEEARDDVELSSEVEVAHVRAVQRHVGRALSGDTQQSFVDVGPFAREPRA